MSLISWQHFPEHINPNIVEIGSFQIRYYSLMYIIAFLLTYILVSYRVNREKYNFKTEVIQDFFIWAIVGLIFGARFGYVFFYNFDYYMRNPLEIILPFEFAHGMRYVGISGMSYHGGAIGVFLASLIFCRKNKIQFWSLADLVCPAVPLGYTFGRIGNFINGELFGRVTGMPWGMYFPLDFTHQLRHPSQLYEAFFEGIVLFLLLWSIRKKSPFDGFLLAIYLIGYGFVRFIIEFFREPDPPHGLLWGLLSMGQILCLLMMIIGACVYMFRWMQKKKAPLKAM